MWRHLTDPDYKGSRWDGLCTFIVTQHLLLLLLRLEDCVFVYITLFTGKVARSSYNTPSTWVKIWVTIKISFLGTPEVGTHVFQNKEDSCQLDI